MKIVIDREKLRRRAALSHAASLGGLLVLLGSVAISLWRPQLQTIPAIMLFGGGTLALVGIYFANRWVKKPRPEDVIDGALKGLGAQFVIYHYLLPCDHVLLTPNGPVVIETVNLEGKFEYKDAKWRQKITAGRAMRFFVEEKFGDPTTRARAGANLIQERLAAQLPDDARFSVEAVVLFTNPLAEVRAQNPPAPVCQPSKLSARLPKGSSKLPKDLYDQIRGTLDGMANVGSEL